MESYPQMFKYVSETETKRNDEESGYFSNERENVPYIITTSNHRVVSKEPVETKFGKLTNVKKTLRFQKSALELNKKTKSSLYNKLTQRGMDRVQTLGSLRKNNFTLEKNKTRLSSLRSSSDTRNPFKQRVILYSRNTAKEQQHRVMTPDEDTIPEDVENYDQNVSGSDYSRGHLITESYSHSKHVGLNFYISAR